MVVNRKYPIIHILITLTVALGEEYRFSLSSAKPIIFKTHHWLHPASNSTMDINGIEVDIFQWRAAAEHRESVRVELVNPVWKLSGRTKDDMSLPGAVTISKVLSFRGTPIIYIKVIPWRNTGNEVEVLSGGEIRIWVDTPDFPVTFTHPYLLNSEKHKLQRTITDETQYLIIYPPRFEGAARSLADMHTDSVDYDYQLNTEIVATNNISNNITGIDLRNYIIDRIELDLKNDLNFLLLLGDEADIPPILFNNSYPSDDFYSTPEANSGDPQLITGRIPVRTVEEAITVVKKIHNYIVNPTPGIWRSKVALVADDMYKSCSLDEGEGSHTSNSQEIYNTFKTLLPVIPYYGVNYNLDNCRYPDLTRDLIQTINNGVALINYIGHGDPTTWAGERFINKSRDLPLIHANDNRLAIWVAGTCSFGNYYGENSFMEDLLIKEDGAIAVVASTEAVGYIENYNYVNALFNEIYNYINDPDDMVKSRLGEIVWNAKNGDKKFHTFSDPALPLPLPKIGLNIVENYPENVTLIDEESISFNEASSHSSILIRENEKKMIFDYGSGNLVYMVPGETYVQMDVSGSTTCFRIPLDAGSCESCVVIQAYQDDTGWDGRIETISGISILGSAEDSEDTQGPAILLSQANSAVNSGSTIFPNMDLTVSLDDESGINLMETIGHGIRYAFDDDNEVLVSGNEFIYTNCSGGFVNIPIPLSISEGTHQLSLEAWDGLNNKTDTLIYLELLSPIDENKLHLSKVYPVPSPFSTNTHFTMITTHFPVKIIINIYSINGIQVQTLSPPIIEEANGGFVSIGWDGRDKYGNKIANGVYFYHVKAETNNNLVFEEIYKLSKIE